MEYTIQDNKDLTMYYVRELYDSLNLATLLATIPILFTAHLLGDWRLVEAYFFVTFADLALGIINSYYNHKFNWDRLGKWVIKLSTHCVVIILVGIVGAVLKIATTVDVHLLNLALAVLTIQEISSILRNMCKMGLPVPPFIIALTKKMNKRLMRKLDDEDSDSGTL
jgi:phage-related holin